ncbi:hypothetical protein [Roseibium sp.]|uniref:hypothetical protein n=1 Tax=Roseibium sp. TaxID=1936156 RepID=UPI003D11DCB5
MTIPRCGIIGLMATLFFAGPAAADQTIEIRLPQLASIPEYTVPLLELALSKQDRPFKIVLPENSKDLTAVEVMEKLTDPASSEFNLYAAGTSKHYEEIALPIRVPLVRGLIGARINAIPKGSQDKFLPVNTVGDLQNMTFLQGIDWGDIAILEGAGLTVKTARKSHLYPMIASADADAFPRASVEILSERAEYRQLDYDIEQEVVLIYDRFPFYFFTGKHNEDLAEIIETGLVTAYEDGSFIQYFRTHPMIREIFAELHLDSRRPIRFDNPNLTPETAALPDYYWHKFSGEPE